MSRNIILSMLRSEASFLQDFIHSLKKTKGDLWEKADPNTPRGRRAFTEYSRARDDLRKNRERLKKINLTIKAVKQGQAF